RNQETGSGRGSASRFSLRRSAMNRIAVVLVGVFMDGTAWAQKPPLLPEKDVGAIAQEISGETAKRNLEGIARFHRQRGSQGFHLAAELVAGRVRGDGFEGWANFG